MYFLQLKAADFSGFNGIAQLGGGGGAVFYTRNYSG